MAMLQYVMAETQRAQMASTVLDAPPLEPRNNWALAKEPLSLLNDLDEIKKLDEAHISQ